MTHQEQTILHTCGLFQNIPPEEIPPLLRCLRIQEAHFDKGDILWNMGDPVSSCAVILSGALRAETVNAAGTRSLMAFHRPGALVGDVLMATPGGKSPVYVTAAENTTLLFLPFSRIMDSCPSCCSRHRILRENLISEIAQKFWAQRQRSHYLTVGSLRRRIALRLRDVSAETGSTTVSLGGTREDLADYLAVNRSALCRELSRMKADGLLDYRRDTFRILQPEALNALADGS